MFDDITEIRKTRAEYSARMLRSGIGAFRKMAELEADILRDGALSQKNKELIALGISISQGCYG